MIMYYNQTMNENRLKVRLVVSLGELIMILDQVDVSTTC